ncbi:type II secretory pathway component PulJ [Methylobacterium sp. PvP062]|uniref:Type II secretory pathway component PulJ n=2 Tax=Methylobacterium TaxID=407 RepID=A0ABV2NPA0_9HYPH|nr:MULTISPECIES: hypothetical protein [unclassified Methylobacterium]MBP2494919.1 type II secretory pathway component PulJ [Methylobacterium sp. PvP105]MBP2505210.1 type II secretory pathway component PulJ [Methylobacterium sp. PvP109]MCX7330038.1 hypothetical protein [Hyphomicrobiales bacterium]SFT11947.1 hypothetical protein SAMN04487845_11753 [Methylobacterium sp. yr668]
MTQQLQQTQQMQMQPRDTDTRLGILETAVSDIRSVMQDIRSDLKTRSSINWAPVNIMLAVCTVAGGMFFTWVNSNNGRLEGAIAKVEARTEAYVPRQDLDTRFAVVSQRRDDLQRLTDARVERVERDLDTITKQLVPRGEHEQMWAAQRARDADLQRQSDQNRQGLYDLNTPRDTIQGMQRRIDELERDARAPARR